VRDAISSEGPGAPDGGRQFGDGRR